MEWAVKLIESLPPLSRIVTTTTDQLDRYLHANTNPRLTAHSFKRGALSTLLEHVVSGDHDIRFISLMGKHKTDHEELPASTIRYLTGSATEARWQELSERRRRPYYSEQTVGCRNRPLRR